MRKGQRRHRGRKIKPRIKRLIWDIEVSPNIGFFWRAGWRVSIPHDSILHEAAILCICYKWQGEQKTYSLEWDRNGCDKKMVEKFAEIAKQADELVAHNGDRFDIKWLNTRMVYHDIEPPPIWKTVDTFVIAKRRFRFNSNKLDYLAKFFFGRGKIRTEFEWWTNLVVSVVAPNLLPGCMKRSPRFMAKMVKYCKKDVRLLERVFERLEPYHKPKSHVGRLNYGEKWMCPWTGSTEVQAHKTVVTAAGTLRKQMISKAENHSPARNRYFTISWKDFERYNECMYEERKKKLENSV